MEEQYDVPECVLIGLEEVRQSGKYNMFGASQVFLELFELKHYDAVVWLAKEDTKNYCKDCLNDYDCENCKHNQVTVDIKKYTAALNELGQLRYLADKLAGN